MGGFPTNISGNRDGEGLRSGFVQDQGESQAELLDSSVSRNCIRSFTGKMFHKVRIKLYPPRGDNKEGWDNIDISDGWAIRCRSR